MSDSLSVRIRVDGEIEIPAGPALMSMAKILKKLLTFEDSSWAWKNENGIKQKGPRFRTAYRTLPDGSMRIARGAWKILKELARELDIELIWDSRVLSPQQRPAQFSFSAQLRPYQQRAVEEILRHQSGVVVIPTGGGKTVVALALAAQLQTQTLFIVHTRELLSQVKRAAQQFLGVEPGVIGSGDWKVAPFTAALIQTLSRRDLSKIKDLFPLVIVDEAHHAPAQTYCEVLPQFPARYRIALTATPYRKDGLHRLLWLQFGDIIFKIDKRTLEAGGKILSPVVHPIPTDFEYLYFDDYVSLISALCNDYYRNKLIVKTIAKTHHPNGCSLVLTERVEHAKKLHSELKKLSLPVGLLHGKMNQKKREEVMEKLRKGEVKILVATLSLIGEGWDHPPLDTLYLTVPNGNRTKTTQALGRILRPYPKKQRPRVFDFVDYKVGILRSQWMARARVYGLSYEEIRAALQLPASEEKENKSHFQNISKSKVLEAIRAIQRKEFELAQEILRSNSSPLKDE